MWKKKVIKRRAEITECCFRQKQINAVKTTNIKDEKQEERK